MTPYLLHQLLTRSAEQHPERVAVTDGVSNLSYEQLESRANQVAWHLIAAGVGPGDRVGLHAHKSCATVASLYGIMKAGAVYVPLDPLSPTARLTTILKDCGATHLMTDSRLRDTASQLCMSLEAFQHVTVLDASADDLMDGRIRVQGSSHLEAQSQNSPPIDVIDQDLAYILYTSGSTGTPKGVMLSHQNAIAFVRWGASTYEVGHQDRLSNHAPLHFDLSVFDIFVAALAGAAVVLVPQRITRFPAAVSAFIAQQRLTIWYSVPSALTLLLQRGGLEPGDFPHLRRILFAGEVFPVKHLRRLMEMLPHVRFANLYGPTETNVCTAHELPSIPGEDVTAIPIGRPIDNVDALILDQADRPVPDGEIGELYVRGSTVMQGYWAAPQKTRRALLADPRGLTGGLSYRTGDLVRRRSDGNIEFLGRQDNQIKSRGYRIELGEIEAALNLHPEVFEAVAIAVPDELQSNIVKAIVTTTRSLRPDALRTFCASRLPSYMVPEEIEVRSELPRTSTGKVDRRALLA